MPPLGSTHPTRASPARWACYARRVRRRTRGWRTPRRPRWARRAPRSSPTPPQRTAPPRDTCRYARLRVRAQAACARARARARLVHMITCTCTRVPASAVHVRLQSLLETCTSAGSLGTSLGPHGSLAAAVGGSTGGRVGTSTDGTGAAGGSPKATLQHPVPQHPVPQHPVRGVPLAAALHRPLWVTVPSFFGRRVEGEGTTAQPATLRGEPPQPATLATHACNRIRRDARLPPCCRHQLGTVAHGHARRLVRPPLAACSTM